MLTKRRETCCQVQVTMTMTMTHSEKSHIGQMKAWPYRQECRGHGSTKKNLSYKGNLLLGKVCKYKLLWTECNASWLEMNSLYKRKKSDSKSHRLLLCSIHDKFIESSDSEQHPQKNTRIREPGGTGRTRKPGHQDKGPRRKAGRLRAAVAPAAYPKFLFLRPVYNLSLDFFQLRTHHVLLDFIGSRSPCS